MQSVVEAILNITGECRLVDSTRRALTPDNQNVPGNMHILEIFREIQGTNECVYSMEIHVYADSIIDALKRAKATINDSLLVLKAVLNIYNSLKS
ncbi:MAG: hypothetical protein LM567_00790 [Desulfurococcaceae archaeon]|jgi:hypothetical protein|nr:hypothetical protein [Desulfurococcaceae archaeon]